MIFADLDLRVFRLINDAARDSAAFAVLGTFAASYLIVAMVVAAIAWRIMKGGRGADVVQFIARGAVAVVAALSANAVIGIIWFRVRPFVALDAVTKLADVSPWLKSFPSDHAASAFAIATFLAIEDRRLMLPVFATASLIAFGRVAAGVHYPSDVIAGAAIGVACALVVDRLVEEKKYRDHEKNRA